jgi:hypothetical protein
MSASEWLCYILCMQSTVKAAMLLHSGLNLLEFKVRPHSPAQSCRNRAVLQVLLAHL